MPLLNTLETIPPDLLTVEPTRIDRVLPGPTLIHLAGRSGRPLFVSVLLHGNETTGLLAAQWLLSAYANRLPPRPLSIFFGNIAATRAGLRRLDDQVDYNRIWPGTAHPPGPEVAMATTIVEEMAGREVFASIDVHNNTGTNPHYACVNDLNRHSLHLAALFGRLGILSTHPRGTQTGAFAELCPSVTLECGKPGQDFGARHAFEFLDACLHLTQFPEHAVATRDLELYATVAQVLVRPEVRFGFSDDSLDVTFIPDLDHLNFVSLQAGHLFGAVRGERMPLIALDDHGDDVAERYFTIEKDRLLLARTAMPSMLTLDERVIRQDCLGYLMEHIDAGNAA